MDQEPWDITEEFNSAGGGLGSCGGGGGGGDFEVREPVVSQEYVSSIIRDSLEPLLNDFINNNSSNKAGYTELFWLQHFRRATYCKLCIIYLKRSSIFFQCKLD